MALVIAGVRSHQEADDVKRALDRVPHTLFVLGGEAPVTAPASTNGASWTLPRTVTPMPSTSTSTPSILAGAHRVSVPTISLDSPRLGALTTVALSSTGLALASNDALAAGVSTHLEIAGPRGPFRVWVMVVSTKQHGGLHIAEATPMQSTPAWRAFVDECRLS
jgi:hypothetical protein